MVQEFSRRELLWPGAALAAGLVLGVGRSADAAEESTTKKKKKGKGKRKKAEAQATRCVVVWSEGTAPKKVYPNDINTAIAEGLQKDLTDWEVVKANLSDPDQGLPSSLLNRADVLIWWGHQKHGDVKDELVERIIKRVKEDGMGFISLHSSHFAKPNKKLMGTACSWKAYRGDSTTLKVTVKSPDHPIARDVQEFTIQHEERYTDPYAVPTPKAVVFEGTYAVKDGSTDTSQQGLTWEVGKGKFFYFQPGHETNPVFFDPNIRKIMANAVQWAAPSR